MVFGSEYLGIRYEIVLIVEAQAADIPENEVNRERFCLRTVPCNARHGVGEIQSVDVDSAFIKGQGNPPGPAGKLQHFGAIHFCQVNPKGDIRLPGGPCNLGLVNLTVKKDRLVYWAASSSPNSVA